MTASQYSDLEVRLIHAESLFTGILACGPKAIQIREALGVLLNMVVVERIRAQERERRESQRADHSLSEGCLEG